jgi:hypothetical protein
MHFAPEKGVYVYFRYDKNDTIMVVMNKNKEATSIDMSRFEEITRGRSIASNVLGGRSVGLDALTVDPGSATVFELK